jgi:hypothetical protein
MRLDLAENLETNVVVHQLDRKSGQPAARDRRLEMKLSEQFAGFILVGLVFGSFCSVQAAPMDKMQSSKTIAVQTLRVFNSRRLCLDAYSALTPRSPVRMRTTSSIAIT